MKWIKATGKKTFAVFRLLNERRGVSMKSEKRKRREKSCKLNFNSFTSRPFAFAVFFSRRPSSIFCSSDNKILINSSEMNTEAVWTGWRRNETIGGENDFMMQFRQSEQDAVLFKHRREVEKSLSFLSTPSCHQLFSHQIFCSRKKNISRSANKSQAARALVPHLTPSG